MRRFVVMVALIFCGPPSIAGQESAGAPRAPKRVATLTAGVGNAMGGSGCRRSGTSPGSGSPHFWALDTHRASILGTRLDRRLPPESAASLPDSNIGAFSHSPCVKSSSRLRSTKIPTGCMDRGWRWGTSSPRGVVSPSWHLWVWGMPPRHRRRRARSGSCSESAWAIPGGVKSASSEWANMPVRHVGEHELEFA